MPWKWFVRLNMIFFETYRYIVICGHYYMHHQCTSASQTQFDTNTQFYLVFNRDMHQ